MARSPERLKSSPINYLSRAFHPARMLSGPAIPMEGSSGTRRSPTAQSGAAWQAEHRPRHRCTPHRDDFGSVQRVVQDRPKLAKLTFVISWNLATSTRRGARLSQRQKFESKVASWKSTVAGAANIEFDLIQESDLLALLAQPEHRGREWFWWAEPVLGDDWLIHRLAEQSDAAGERYRAGPPSRSADRGTISRHLARPTRSGGVREAPTEGHGCWPRECVWRLPDQGPRQAP